MAKFGAISTRIGGRALRMSGENVVFVPGGNTRETVMASDGSAGHKMAPTATRLEIDVYDDTEIEQADLRGIEDEDVTLHVANGKTYVLFEASQVGELSYNVTDGTTRLVLEARDYQEVQ